MILDRVPYFDERSRAYGVQLQADQARSYVWACPAWLDQGSEGACVGFSWAHELAARPFVRPADNELALELYRGAQAQDRAMGNHWPSGASILAGAKAAQEAGHIGEYRWAFSTRDALAAISRKGPAVIGVWWWTGMFRPDGSGFLNPSGQREGGHAILVRGVRIVWKPRTTTAQKRSPEWWSHVDHDRSYVVLRNSWGVDWGLNGDAYLSWADFDSLLQDGGECCIPVVRGAN